MDFAKLCIIAYVSFVCVAAKEICVWEVVNASCSVDQVVSIETALYGRMSNSRCFNMTENETECSDDFRLPLQKKFGGKQNIHFNAVNDIFTKTTTNCANGPPFLEFTYQCINLIKRETCVWETFNATCPHGTVIFIQKALYGRMHSSHCIAFENTGLDCYANVQLYLEKQCNGRSECRVRASNQQLTSAESSCPKRQKPYLEVEYTCTHGFSCPPFQPPEGANIFRTSIGYLVTCPNDTNTKELLCRDGSWSKDPKKICPTHGTVIVIQSALYGRMRSGRCTSFDNRDINCSANVQPLLERLCNGRNECSIKASRDSLRQAKSSCSKGLKPYLGVLYTCVQELNCPLPNLHTGASKQWINDGYNITCDHKSSTTIRCIDGKWDPNPLELCEGKYGVIELLIFVNTVGVFMLIAIIFVVVCLKRIQKNSKSKKSSVARRQNTVDDGDYPESHLRRPRINCDSVSEYEYQYEYDVQQENGSNESYSYVRKAGP